MTGKVLQYLIVNNPAILQPLSNIKQEKDVFDQGKFLVMQTTLTSFVIVNHMISRGKNRMEKNSDAKLRNVSNIFLFI